MGNQKTMNSWSSSALRALGLVVAGALGALGTLHFKRTEAQATLTTGEARSNAKRSDEGAQAAKESPGLARRLHSVEHRLGALEDKSSETEEERGESASARSPAVDEPPPDLPPPSFYYEEHERNIANHRAEPVDRDWSPRTSEALRKDAERIAEAGKYSIEEVECRDSTCRISVRWDTMGTARASYEELLHQPMAAQCERTIIVPNRAPGEPVNATMLLDCAEWKANGSEFVDLSKSAPMVIPEG